MNQGTILGSQIGRLIVLAALVALLGAMLLTIRPVGAQSNAPISVNYPENSTGAVGSPVYAQDPERRGVNWRVEGTDPDHFEITTNNNVGTLRFKESSRLRGPPWMPTKITSTQCPSEPSTLAAEYLRREPSTFRSPTSKSLGWSPFLTTATNPGMAACSPSVDVQLLAYATDPDHIQDDIDTTVDDVTWQWHRGNQSSSRLQRQRQR